MTTPPSADCMACDKGSRDRWLGAYTLQPPTKKERPVTICHSCYLNLWEDYVGDAND